MLTVVYFINQVVSRLERCAFCLKDLQKLLFRKLREFSSCTNGMHCVVYASFGKIRVRALSKITKSYIEALERMAPQDISCNGLALA